jgi:hypothetical protein
MLRVEIDKMSSDAILRSSNLGYFFSAFTTLESIATPSAGTQLGSAHSP